jgi:hypothetical protein
MYLNMLFLTLLFIDTGCPSSSSTPASPPSPARPAIFRRSSSSSWAIVFLPVVVLLLLSLSSLVGLASKDGDCAELSFLPLVEVELERMRRTVWARVSWRREAVRMESMVVVVRSYLMMVERRLICLAPTVELRGHFHCLIYCLSHDYQQWHHREKCCVM